MLDFYHDDHYYDRQGEGGYENYAAQETALKLTFSNLLRRLHRAGLTGGYLLEVGCGFGFLLETAAAYFKLRHGTEFSHRAARAAAARADRIFLGGADQAAAGQRYDTIIANHVIEHVYEPHAFMRELALRLKPEGAVVISTPDMGGFWRGLMGKRWPSFKIPEHILYFDERSLAHLLRETGFSAIRRVAYSHAFPLSLVAAKFGLRIPKPLASLTIWIPGTTLALVATRAS